MMGLFIQKSAEMKMLCGIMLKVYYILYSIYKYILYIKVTRLNLIESNVISDSN